MRVLICGSRHFNDYEKLRRTLASLSISELIHGGARGADTMAETFARNNNIPYRRFNALWDKHGKSAGPIRNRQMLREGCPDLVVAFLAPNSRGTKDMINAAEKAGVPVKVIKIGE
jgi:hypothetical protein